MYESFFIAGQNLGITHPCCRVYNCPWARDLVPLDRVIAYALSESYCLMHMLMFQNHLKYAGQVPHWTKDSKVICCLKWD